MKVIDYCMKLIGRMDGKAYCSGDYIVDIFGANRVDGEAQSICDGVDQVNEQVKAVNRMYCYRYGIECGVRLEIHSHNAVALLRGSADGLLAVTLVKGYLATVTFRI